MKKKIVALLLAMTMVLALVACGGNSTSSDKSSSDKSESKNDDRVLRMCSSEVLPTIDPEEIHKLRVNEIIYNVYEGLIYYN